MSRRSIVPTQQPDDGLVAALGNLGVDAETAREALRGDGESLESSYSAILDALLGQHRDPLAPDFALVQHHCDKALDMFDEAFETTELFVTVRDILASIGVHDFTIADVVTPDPKRARKHLNALINYIKFLEYKKPMLAELSEEKHRARDSVKALRQDEQEAAVELAKMQQAHAAHEQALRQREGPHREAQEMYASVSAAWANKNEELAAQQDRQAALQTALKEAQLQQETKAHELIALRGQLAGDPKTVADEMQTLKARVASEWKEIERLEAQLMKTTHRDQAVTKVTNNLRSFVEYAQERVEPSVARWKELKADVKEAQKGVAELRSTEAKLQRDMNNICEEIRNQAALNDRLLTKARGEVQMAHDKRETAERFVANLEYGNAKTAERAQEQRFKEQQSKQAKEDVDVRWAEQLREFAHLQGSVRKYLEAHNDAFQFLHDAAESDTLRPKASIPTDLSKTGTAACVI